jgi:hypothetical protein
LTLDGRTLPGNPFAARVAKDNDMHTLIATADGYETLQRPLAFDRGFSITLNLTRKRANAGGVDRADTLARAKKAPDPVRQKDGPREAFPRGATTDGEDKPGMDLRRGAPSKVGTRHIDEKDPYTP